MPPGTDRRTSVVVVIAAYNEARVIGDVVRAVLADGWCVVVVDDGSADQTFEQLAHLPVWRLRHIVNRGQGAALQTGIRHALSLGAEVIVTFDADGQHDPSQIIDIVEPVASGRCSSLRRRCSLPRCGLESLRLAIFPSTAGDRRTVHDRFYENGTNVVPLDTVPVVGKCLDRRR